MFDPQRFLRLATVHWAEHRRSILWFLGIGIAVHFCVWLLVTQGGTQRQHYELDTQVFLYLAGYLLTGMLFAGRHFAALSDRGSALTLLMRPASSFEKTLLAFMMVAVFYPVAYTLAFQVCNLPAALLGEAARDALLATRESGAGDAQAMGEHLTSLEYGPYLPLTSGWDVLAGEVNLLLGGSALQALVVVGTLYYRRLAWLKTLVSLFVLLIVAIPLLSMLLDASLGRLFLDGLGRGGPGWLRAWVIALWIAVPMLFWASAFFFLRERELS